MTRESPPGRVATLVDVAATGRRSEPWYRSLFVTHLDGILVTDLEGRIEEANPTFLDMLGYSLEDLRGLTHQQLTPSRWAEQDAEERALVLAGGRSQGKEKEMIRLDGSVVPVRLRDWVLRDDSGRPTHLAAVVRDISVRKAAEAELRLREEKYSNLFHDSNDAILISGLDGKIQEANRRAVALFGYSSEEILALRLTDLNPAYSRPQLRLASAAITVEGYHRFEIDLIKKSGDIFPAEISSSLFEVAGERLVKSDVLDITARRRAAERLQQAAFNDALTGLPNRTVLRDRLDVAIGRARRRATARYALLLVDLDRFQRVNDSLGHDIGDQMLRTIACRIAGCLRDGDLLASMGGDEFAVLMTEISGVIDARQTADRIQRELLRPVSVDAHELFTSASIGICVSHSRIETCDDGLRYVDTALRRAKAQGRGRQVVFNPGLHGRAVEQLQLENGLRRAVGGQELRLFYQPIVNLEDGSIRELEALVRWQHPERGLLNPQTFLDLAEEIGEIRAIDEWVLRGACHQAAAWGGDAGAGPAIAINVSSRHFTCRELVPLVEEVLDETGLPAIKLRLEVTESALIDEPEEAVQVLTSLRHLGVQVALDDFGTGYSSLGYLHRFPVDVLKIDRSFVTGGEGKEIVRAVVFLGRNLGMEIIAEGIETAEDLQRVRSLGCQLGQGFYFARPLEPAAVAQLLASPSPVWSPLARGAPDAPA